MKIEIHLKETHYCPGEKVSGYCEWVSTSDKPPKWVLVSLLWYTEGFPNQQVQVVQQIKQESPDSSGIINFEFTMPNYPLSYQGKLFNIRWALEAGLGRGEVDRVNLTTEPKFVAN